MNVQAYLPGAYDSSSSPEGKTLNEGRVVTSYFLHADVDAKNQQRRVFYAFQLSWSADQQMQVFGRVYRSHQVSAPIIRLVLLDLAGQKRQVNAVSKRLAALGALTKGERQSLGGNLFRPEDVTDEFGPPPCRDSIRRSSATNTRTPDSACVI